MVGMGDALCKGIFPRNLEDLDVVKGWAGAGAALCWVRPSSDCSIPLTSGGLGSSQF